VGKLTDEIMSDLRKRSGGGGSSESTEDDEDGMDVEGADDEEEYASDEEKAMADFTDATTPAEKARALRAFLEICVPEIVGKG
jgi:hypothetical protein